MDTSSSPAPVTDVTNTLTQKLRGLSRKSSLLDYFAKTPSSSQPSSSPTLTRQNSAELSQSTTDVPSSPICENSSQKTRVEDASDASQSQGVSPASQGPKKLKLTAENGRKAAQRLQMPQKKRLKAEGSFGEGSRLGGRGAKLGFLPAFPLDVIFEIFSHLGPLDLLSLARTTKALRQLLMHRSSSTVWKAVLACDPKLPACPDDMSLPAWAHLAFDSHCHNCRASKASKCVDFRLRVRLCSKCAKTLLICKKKFRNTGKKEDAILLRAIPFSERCSDFEKYCTVADKERFLKELNEWKGDRNEFVAARIAATKTRKEHAKLARKWYADVIEAREAELDNIRVERRDQIRLRLVKEGYEKELDFLEDLRNEDYAIIPTPNIVLFHEHPDVKKPVPLTERMWSGIKPSLEFYMEKVRVLRDRNEECYRERERRLEINKLYLQFRLKPENLAMFPSNVLMPTPVDVYQMYQTRIKRDEDIAPIDDEQRQSLHKDLLAKIKTDMTWQEGLEDDIMHWQGDVHIYLWNIVQCSSSPDLVPPYRHYSMEDRVNHSITVKCRSDLLKLAVISFKCNGLPAIHSAYVRKWLEDEGLSFVQALPYYEQPEIGGRSMWYPEFLFHPCCTTRMTTDDEFNACEYQEIALCHGAGNYIRKSFLELVEKVAYRNGEQQVGRVPPLQFDERSSRVVRSLLDAAGLDWTTTTTEEMDQLDLRFVCMKCTYGSKCDGMRKVRVWAWRDAVQHITKGHLGDWTIKWERISSEDTIKARELEEKERVARGYRKPADQRLWKCMACRDTSNDKGRMTFTELHQHFRAFNSHGDPQAMEGKEGVLYYKALDYSPREHPPVKMIPGPTSTCC